MSTLGSNTLQSIERPLIMRALDYPGYIPIVGGMPVGAVRMICCLAGAIIAGLGALITYAAFTDNKWCGKCTFAAKYLIGECLRGVTEFGCLSYICDKESEKQELDLDEVRAYGNYICTSSQGFLAYSKNYHGGQEVPTWWKTVGKTIRDC